MVVGQDLGVTLDLETWNVKAAARGVRQLTDLVPLAVTAAEDGSAACRCNTTRPAPT